jgi:hypothetical protein
MVTGQDPAAETKGSVANGEEGNAVMVPPPKKPKKKKAAAAAAAAAEAALAASKAEAEDEKPKPKSKKKKDAGASVVNKGKKRGADEMSVANSDAGGAAQPIAIDDDAEDVKKGVAAKKPIKKAKAAVVQPPAPVETPVEPPKKKAKKAAPPAVKTEGIPVQMPNPSTGIPMTGTGSVPNMPFTADPSVPQLTQEQLDLISQQLAVQGMGMPGFTGADLPMQMDQQALSDASAQQPFVPDAGDANGALAEFIASLASTATDLPGVPDMTAMMGSRAPGGSRAPPGQ